MIEVSIETLATTNVAKEEGVSAQSRVARIAKGERPLLTAK